MMNQGIKRTLIKRQVVDNLKQQASNYMISSDPRFINNEDPKTKQFRQERKKSLNKTNTAFYNNQNGIQASSSLKRNYNQVYVNAPTTNNNPWSTNRFQNKPYQNGQNQPQYSQQLQNSYDENTRSLKQRNQQHLPQLTSSPQKSSIKYGQESSEKKGDYYQVLQQQNQQFTDKALNDGIGKSLNNSKTNKQTLKVLVNEKNSSSKENLHEGQKKEYQLPSIPKQQQQEYKSIIQQDIHSIKPTDHISSNSNSVQNKAYFNHDQSQRQYDNALHDSQKENYTGNKNIDFVIQNRVITKNNTFNMNPKNGFSTTPTNNSNIPGNASKQTDERAPLNKESSVKSNLASSIHNGSNPKDNLEDKLEKIYESVKNTSSQQNNYGLPPKYQKIEDKENTKIETKEKSTLKEDTLNSSKQNKFESVISKSRIQENDYVQKSEQQQQINEQVLERKPSFQIRVKNESSSMNPLARYYKYDFDFSKHNFTFSKRSSAGLNNIGNTCFMNSALQCVLNTPVFNEFFFSGAFEKDINPKNKGVAQSYSGLIKQVRSTGSSQSQAPYSLKKSIERVSSQFYGTDQQDAQELLRCLLDGLHEDLNRVRTKPKYRELEADTSKRSLQEISDDWYQYYKGRDDSVVTDFFSGQLLSKVKCSKCNNESLAFDNFMDLSLSFSRGQENEADLVDLLSSFLKEENLDDDYYCSKCKARTKSRRQFELHKLPQILVIHLKRFNFGRFNRNKISSSVSFPVTNFDLSRFIQNSNDPSVKNSKYELFGIVNHSGSLSGGHYTAESLNPYEGKWYNYNDSHAGQISTDSVNRYQSSGRSSPYLLFYCKSELLLPYQQNNGYEHQRMKSNL